MMCIINLGISEMEAAQHGGKDKAAMNDLSDLRVWAQGSSNILAHTGLGLGQLPGKKRDLNIGKTWGRVE